MERAYTIEKKLLGGGDYSKEYATVRLRAGFAWNNSASNSETRTITIGPKQYGWFEYSSYKNTSHGYLKTFKWTGELKSQVWTVGYSPKKVNGHLDGIYYMMTASAPPR